MSDGGRSDMMITPSPSRCKPFLTVPPVIAEQQQFSPARH
jgi:hypothetical protein